jgi:hypothetical protein
MRGVSAGFAARGNQGCGRLRAHLATETPRIDAIFGSVAPHRGDRPMPFIKLTHMVGAAKKDLYVNSDQIVRINDPIGPSAGYQASLLLASGSQDVLETVDQVMALIQGAKTAGG